MKRILAIICVLACLCGFALPAMAAPDTITVYVDAPSDWAQVSLYVWVDDNGTTTPLWDWPGSAMKKGDDGWYALEIPAGHNRVIASNGNGIQTVDLIMDGSMDAWLTVTTAGSDGKFNGDIVYVNPGPAQGGNGGSTTEPGEPAPLTSMALVGEGNDALKWDPADTSCNMATLGDGIYTKELTMYKGATIQFKFCGNGAWDAGYDFGGAEGGVTAGTAVALTAGGQNLSYTATQDCTLTVTLDMNGDAPTVTVSEAPAELAPPPVKTMVKLYVSVAGEFTPSVWAWGDNSNAFPNWPGQAMTKEGDWWVIEIPDDCHSAIVNDGVAESGVKTTDLAITMGAVNYIVVDEAWAATVSTTKPDGQPAPKPTTPNNPTTPSGEAEGEGEGENENENKGGPNVFVIVTIVLAVLTVGAVVATVIILKKKKG